MARRFFAGFLKYFSTPTAILEGSYPPTQGAIVSVQSNAILLAGLKAVRQGQLLSLQSGQKAWVIALLRNYVGAVVLSKEQPCLNVSAAVASGSMTLAVGADLFGKTHSSLTQLITEKNSKDLLAFLREKLLLTSKRGALQWMRTGYFQIDVFTPLVLGQFVCFKGKKNSGKNTVCINTVKQFLQSGDNHRAIFVATNPFSSTAQAMALVKDSECGPKLAVYVPAVEDGVVGQFLMPYAALMNAAHMRDSGTHVLLVLDDALCQAKTCITAFAAFQPHFSPLGFVNLCFDHSRVKGSGSLTSFVVFHENTEDGSAEYRTVSQHLESLVDRTVAFREAEGPFKGAMPAIDFRTHRDSVQSLAQWPIFRHVARKLNRVLDDLVEQRRMEEGRREVGIYTAPWDKYLLLDSRYFLKLMLCSESLAPSELILFTQFVVYSIENELTSTLKAEMPVVRSEFFAFLKESMSPKTRRVLDTLPQLKTQQEVDEACEVFDREINEKFYEALKMKGMLKEFKEDYDEIILGSSSGGLTALDRSDGPTGPKEREFFKEAMQSIGLAKK